MPMTPLSLETLSELDDRILLAFQFELKRAVLDCMDRPGDKTERVVSMEFKIVPIVGQDGDCEGATGEFHVKGKVPTRKSKPYSFEVNRGGQLVFSTTNTDNVNQSTFDDVDPETGKVNRRPAK